MEKFRSEVLARCLSEKLPTPEMYADYLIHNYGIQVNQIFYLLGRRKEKNPEIKLALAELTFTFDHEMVAFPADFLIRRTGRLYFVPESVRMLAKHIVHDWAEVFKKTKSEEVDMVQKIMDDYEDVRHFS